MTTETQKTIESLATQDQAEKYALAYVHIFNMAKAVTEHERKKMPFTCSKQGKNDMAKASLSKLQLITPTDPIQSVVSIKILEYVMEMSKGKAETKGIEKLPNIVTMMINTLITYYDEQYKSTKNNKYLEIKEGVQTQKVIWEGMLSLLKANIKLK